METDKNKLEHLLYNNLFKKRERLQADLQDMTGEDRVQKLEMSRIEIETVNARLTENNSRFKGKKSESVVMINVPSPPPPEKKTRKRKKINLQKLQKPHLSPDHVGIM